MGSLSSRPPAPPPVQQIAPPPRSAVTAAPALPATGAASAGVQDTQAAASEARRESLLRRDRSRVGTVQTGFRGLLSQNVPNNTERKTLLGE